MDPERNALIVADVVQEAGSGVSLVLRTASPIAKPWRSCWRSRGRGGIPDWGFIPRPRQAVMKTVQSGQVQVLLATGQLSGEKFDCPGLTTLFLATLSRFSGRVWQYLGRVLQPAPGQERARVYDYQDVHVVVPAHVARARAQV